MVRSYIGVNIMDNIEKVLEKQELRYVLGTAISGRPMYLKKKLQKIEYSFTTDITDATKTYSSKIARMMLDNYIYDTGDTGSELVIIPLVISYELVKIID